MTLTNGTNSNNTPRPKPFKSTCEWPDIPEQYQWQSVHNDLEANKHCGTYGADNAPWIALAGIRAGVDLNQFHKIRSPDEFYVPELDKLFQNDRTRRRWKVCIYNTDCNKHCNRCTNKLLLTCDQ